ncbi:hypothetical protein EC9_25170 [Rosistilla ulvae]|uniref:Uncharacterized protein n=1 Tax=Rosistilla ulvae TaxID=1930277 RepID=A0A517M0D2_9BACT|nr:nucleotidyltransferase family protein [Rosistilla ulvae]QDS88327.1 hypothetical protein EC9_25170 [Rosistilla ulvae]
MSIGEATLREVRRRLRGNGIGLTLGLYEFRLQSPIAEIAVGVHRLYPHHPLRDPADFSTFQVRHDPTIVRGKRGVISTVNGKVWHQWPARLTVGAIEWIFSHCIFRGADDALAVHAAAAVRPGGNGGAIVFPGQSGAGKSTLASTLMMSGWGLLSDEISLFDLADFRITGLGRPTILKGHSLEMMSQRYGERAVFGPSGRILDPPVRVAHLLPTEETRKLSGQRFAPVAIVFPHRSPNVELQLSRVERGTLFSRLLQHGLNFRLLGKRGFEFAVELAKHLPAYDLVYDDAADAEKFLRDNSLFDDIPSLGLTESSTGRAAPRKGPASSNIRKPQTRETPSQSVPKLHRSASPPHGPAIRDVGGVADGLQLLVEALHTPDLLAELTLKQWNHLILIANHTELLPRIARRLSDPELFSLPEVVQHVLLRVNQREELIRKTVEFELLHLRQFLLAVCDRVVLLKGAAYIAADLPWARGRNTNDLDLLVPEESVACVERALVDAGYQSDEKISDADARYYRRWLHETPPLHHPYRRLELDVHFRLLPRADPNSFCADEFIERSVPIAGSPFRMLDPIDRTLHAIINIAHIGDYRRAYRDLWDIYCLIEGGPGNPHGNSATPFDWDIFAKRTTQLGIGRAVATILLLVADLVGRGRPQHVCQLLLQERPERMRRRRLYKDMRRAAVPDGPTLRSRGRRFAMWKMEHYPLPRFQTWLDPLTWTKRIQFTKDV